MVGAFHDGHAALYGYHFRGRENQEVEWVNVRVAGIGAAVHPEIRELATALPTGLTDSADGSATDRRRTRRVYFDDWTIADIVDRPTLRPGDVVDGPAILEEFGSTVPVHPGFRAEIDRFGNVLLSRAAGRRHPEAGSR